MKQKTMEIIIHNLPGMIDELREVRSLIYKGSQDAAVNKLNAVICQLDYAMISDEWERRERDGRT